MARRRSRGDDDDDTLERSHRAKRVKGGEKREAKKEPSTEATVVDEATKIERLGAKKEQKKLKAQGGEKGEAKEEPTTEATVVGEATKIERLRAKKERKKLKAQERLQERLSHRAKRVKGGEEGEAKEELSTKATAVDEATKIERLRAKKEQKKLKAQERPKEPKKETPKSDTVTCRKGVSYRDIVIGRGPVVKSRGKVRVEYTLRKHHETGNIIDSSDNFGFQLGKGEVIEGWDIGFKGMRQGGVRHLWIPPEAGYAQKDIGAGKGGILFFKVMLLGC
jgi:FKBP-type peptidyl-prolyl cis-trans isomerase